MFVTLKRRILGSGDSIGFINFSLNPPVSSDTDAEIQRNMTFLTRLSVIEWETMLARYVGQRAQRVNSNNEKSSKGY
jgi:hypothetical protein